MRFAWIRTDDEMQVISHVMSRVNLNFKSDLYHIQSVQTAIRRRKKFVGDYELWFMIFDIESVRCDGKMWDISIFGWLKLFDFSSFSFHSLNQWTPTTIKMIISHENRKYELIWQNEVVNEATYVIRSCISWVEGKGWHN